MKLSEVLTDDRILLGISAEDLAAVLRALCTRLEETGVLEPGRGEALAREIGAGEKGDRIRANEALILCAARTGWVEDLTLALGVASSPFRIDDPGGGGATLARAVLLLLTPRRISTLKVQPIPALLRILRDSERTRRLLEASSPEEIRSFTRLMETDLHDHLLVEDGLTPLQYRVFPETPLEEITDLMIRRRLHALPVVGESLEVMGIITSGDLLKHLLPGRLSGEDDREGEEVRARDMMTRSVMCVSEDQSIMEAANLMVNKDVEQLPVVREGELLGFLTRDTVLRTLFGR